MARAATARAMVAQPKAPWVKAPWVKAPRVKAPRAQGGSAQGGSAQGGEGGWPARYGPRPDFTLPPDNVGTQPGPQFPAERPPAERLPAERLSAERPAAERPAAGRPGRHSSAPGPSADPADSGWFSSPSPYEGARRNGPPEPPSDPYAQQAPGSFDAPPGGTTAPRPGRRRRPDPPDAPPASSPSPSSRPASRVPQDPSAPPARLASRAPQDPSAPAFPPNPPAPSASRIPQDPSAPAFPPAPSAQSASQDPQNPWLPATPSAHPASRAPQDPRDPRDQRDPRDPDPAASPTRPASRAPQNPVVPPAPRAPQAPDGRPPQPGFVPRDEAFQPGFDDTAAYGPPASSSGRRGRGPGREPDDYEFDGRDGYGGRGDPYADQDGYADRGDPYGHQDGYAGPADPYAERDGYAQHVAGPGRPASGGRTPADQEQPWDGEDGYTDDERFVPGLGGRRDEEYDDHGDASGRGGRGGRSGRGGGSSGKRRRRWVIPLVIILIVLLVPVGVGGFYVYRFVQGRYYPADYTTGGTGQTIVQVQSGQTATEVAQRLVTLGVVASERSFQIAAEHSTSSSTLEPGFYRMKKHMKATLAYQLLLNPAARIQDKITIPEGLRLTQIQAQLGAHSGIPLAEYQQALKQPAALGLPSYANGKAEGYLFPATYDVQPKQTATDVLQTMVQRFNQEAESDNLTTAAAAAHLTPGQVITVASLIQAEGGNTSYYPRIARVIYNRLNKNMKLQLDSTVMYGLNTFGIIASNAQLQSNSPYNTYKFAGLPPGPIDSPGHSAIEAALHPSSGNDLYFVTTNPKTGLTQFTSSQTQFEQFRQELEHNLGH